MNVSLYLISHKFHKSCQKVRNSNQNILHRCVCVLGAKINACLFKKMIDSFCGL